MNIADHVLLACAGVVYFRATLTSARDYRIWRKLVGRMPMGPLDGACCDYIRRIGPLRIFDVRILASAGLLSAPPLLYPSLSKSWIFGPLICLAVGAFLSPLLAPTMFEPEANDLRSLPTFILKWLIGKSDIYLKTILVCGALWLSGKIPVVGDLPSQIGLAIFPVIKESRIERHLIDFFPAIIAGMLILRFSLFVAHGYIYAVSAVLSAGWIWFEYQWFFAEQVAVGTPGELLSFSKSVILIQLSDLVLSFASAVIGALGRNDVVDYRPIRHGPGQ